MNKRDEVKYKRLSNTSDEFDARQPLLAAANGHTVEGIPLAERRNAFHEPAVSGHRIEPTQLRARGESSALSSFSPRPDERPAYFERDINPGETLTSISVQYSCPVALLKQVNHLVADQEFHALKVVRVPFRKYGLVSELLALESEENRQRFERVTGRASQQTSAVGTSSPSGLVGNTEETQGTAAVSDMTAEPGSPSTYSDPSDYECDPLLYETHDVCRGSLHQHRIGRGSSSSRSVTGGAQLLDFLKAKDDELKTIAARIEQRASTSTSNDTMMLIRTSPTFPVQIQRTSHNSGGLRTVALVVAFFIICVVVVTVILLKFFHGT